MKRQLIIQSLLIVSLFKTGFTFGSECKQIINEHFFDLTTIESTEDYYFPYKNENEEATQIYFNFCQPVKHSCPGTVPEYHMMATNDSECNYYKPISQNDQFGKENDGNFIYLISKSGQRVEEGVPADGISSLFQGCLTRHFRCESIHSSQHVLQPHQKSPFAQRQQSRQIQEWEPFDFELRVCVVLSAENVGDVLQRVGRYQVGSLRFGDFGGASGAAPRVQIVPTDAGYCGSRVSANDQLSFILSFITSNWLLNFLFISVDTSKFWGYLLIFISVIIGIFCAYIVKKIYKLGIICAGLASGFFMSFLLNFLFLFRIESNPSSVLLTS